MATPTKPTKPTTNLDFSSVFSTNGTSTPFTWLLADYLKGWDSIENTPPSRQQFDALQSHSDKKENWLYNQYLEGYVDKYLAYLDEVKAPINSPVFTGDPKAPTPSFGDNDTSIATTAFVQHWIEDLQSQIDDIEGGEGGGGGGSSSAVGIGVTRTGPWYVCWGDVLYFQFAATTTDSNGEGTVQWPISFRVHPDGTGVYHPVADAAAPGIVTFDLKYPGRHPDHCHFTAIQLDGTPLANTYVAVIAFGQKSSPDTWDLED